MRTQIIIFHRPSNSNISLATDPGQAQFGWSARGIPYSQTLNPNDTFLNPSITNKEDGTGRSLDLYEDINIPINYTIVDVKEPDKTKTAWSKTISIPGTDNNNKIFQHIYQISGDGWVKIGNTSVYQNFNPNIRKEIVVNCDGVQVMKGNLQLKTIRKNSAGRIEYDVMLYGDLTSLFFDVGEAKLSDLNFSEWDHEWSVENISSSFEGNILKSGVPYSNMTFGTANTVTDLRPQQNSATLGNTNRLMVMTTLANNYKVGDFIKLEFTTSTPSTEPYRMVNGTWLVVEVISTKQFVLNHQYPGALRAIGTYTVPSGIGKAYKSQSKGEGYVYPLVSWGDEVDYNTFPVTSMAPGYFVKEIWDKIFKEVNSTYSSNFLNSELFKRLILIQKKTSYDLTLAEVSSRTFGAHTSVGYDVQASYDLNREVSFTLGVTASIENSTYNATGSVPNQLEVRIPFDVETLDVVSATGSGNWNNNTWNVTKNGEYSLSAIMNLSSWIDINGIEQLPFDGTQSISFETINSNLGSNVFGVNGAKNFDGSSLLTGPLGSGQKLRMTAYVNIKRGGSVLKPYVRTEIFDLYPSNSMSAYNLVDSSYAGFGPLAANWENNYRLGYARFQPISWLNRDFTLQAKSIFLKAGDEVYITITQYLQGVSSDTTGYAYTHKQMMVERPDEYGSANIVYNRFRGKWMVRLKTNATIFNVPSSKAVEGSVILGTDFLPKDMSCKDFLKNIIKTYNLHIEADKYVERKYTIEPRDDYYYTGANGLSDYEDWTQKMNPDSVSITPIGELLSKYYTFTNKVETDYWNKRFFDERGRNYMTYKKEIPNDFLKNEIKIETTFGSSVMVNNPDGSDVVMVSLQQRDGNSTKPVSNSAARVLIWVGLRPYSTKKGLNIIPLTTGALNGQVGWELLSTKSVVSAVGVVNNVSTPTVKQYYPYAGTVDSPSDPYYDINWFNSEVGDFVYWDYARWTDNNIYNAYWKNFIDEISDPSSMVVRAYFNLTPKDINQIDFRKIYVIDTVYYRLQKVVDYNPSSDGETLVELLKLKSPVRFTPKSIKVNQTFTTMLDNTRPIGLTIVELAPNIKSIRDSDFQNVLPSTRGNTSTVSVNGSQNYVGDSKNISITGSENYIGDNSFNITLSGSGISVAGGLNNVSIIGTDKISVRESNVSYINGVRYKYGVAISRSNIIDGGSTSATQSLSRTINKTTTINVIDCGEDITIPEGSSSYENIIESGLNSILPDVSEIGITTLTTPSPKSNLSGGYAYQSVRTLKEIVNDNNSYRS